MKIESYSVYQESKINWLGSIPEHWSIVAIKRTAKAGNKCFTDGDWIESPYITNFGIRLIQTGNVGIGIYKEKGWRYISEQTFDNLNCTEIYPNNILICRLDGPVGRACLVPDLQVRMITSVDNTILHPSDEFSPKFIVYLMSSTSWLDWTQALCRVGGGFRFRISRTILGEQEIPKPPLSEQKTIAHYLDTKTAEIDRKIDLLTQKAQRYEELKKSLINETVTRGLDKSVPMKDSGIEWLGEIPEHWELNKISQSFEQIGSGTTPKSGSKIYYENGTINWINTGDLNDNYLTMCKRKVTPDALRDHSLKVYPQGSIVIAMYGATIGKISILKISGCTNQACCVLQKSKVLETRFLFYWFISRRNFIISLSYGGGQPNISQDTIKSLRVAAPSYSEQSKIADYLDTKTAQIDQIIQTINIQIEKLQELRKTLINDVVTGKIKVTLDH